MTKRTYTLTRYQCDTIKEQDRVYVLNARNLLNNTAVPDPVPEGGSCDSPITYTYPSWVPAQLKRLGDEAIARWMKAHPIPSTVIAVAFEQAERRAA